MKNPIWAILLLALALAVPARAQFFPRPNLAPLTVIGNPNMVAGPAQAISFAALQTAITGTVLTNQTIPATVDLTNLPPQTVVGNGTSATAAVGLITFSQLATLNNQVLPHTVYNGFDPTSVPTLTALANAATSAAPATPTALGSVLHNVVAGVYYWSSSTGSDSNPCNSQDFACKTISNFNSFVFPANSTAKFRGGDSFSGSIVIPNSNLTLTSYAVGQPTISSGNSAACITATNLHDLTINNFNCVGGGATTNTTDGIRIYNTAVGGGFTNQLANITITNTTVSAYGDGGIIVWGTNATPAGFNNVTLNNNTIHDVDENCVSCAYIPAAMFVGVQAANYDPVPPTMYIHSNVTMSNNLMYNLLGGPSTCCGTGVGMIISNTNGAEMSFNVVHDYGALNDHCGGPGSGFLYDTTNGIIEKNEAYRGQKGTGGSACDGGGYDLDGNVVNSTMQFNYVHSMIAADFDFLLCSCTTGTYRQWGNNTIRFNISDGTGVTNRTHGGLSIQSFQGAMTNVNIYNNTFLGGPDAAIERPASATAQVTAQISNNIVVGGILIPNATLNSSAFAFQGNDYYTGGATPTFNYNGTIYSSLSAWQTATSQEKLSGNPIGFIVNPIFQSTLTQPTCGGYTPATCPLSYILASNSKLKQPSGLNLTTNFSINPGTQDFFGNAVTASTLPVGAAQAGSVVSPLVQNVYNSSASGTTLAATLPGTAAGNLIVVDIGWCDANNCNSGNATTVSTITSSAGETCSHASGTAQTAHDPNDDIWYCANITGGSDTITATFSGSTFFPQIGVSEWTGFLTASPNDAAVNNSTFISSPGGTLSISTAANTSQTGELVITPVGADQGSFLPTSCIALNLQSGGVSDTFDCYQITAATGIYSNTGTTVGSRSAISIAGFKHP